MRLTTKELTYSISYMAHEVETRDKVIKLRNKTCLREKKKHTETYIYTYIDSHRETDRDRARAQP